MGRGRLICRVGFGAWFRQEAGKPVAGGTAGAEFSRPRVRPNTSFKPTRSGRQRKPGSRHMVHHREPGLRCLPERAA
jgi:hypothetical protein